MKILDSKTIKAFLLGLSICPSLFLLHKLESAFITDSVFKGMVNINYLSFYSFGEYIASVGILVAIMEYNKSKWKLALRIKRKTLYVVYGLIGAGLFSIIYSAIVASRTPYSIFELTLFWQMISAGCVLLALATLFYNTVPKRLLSPKTIESFVSALLISIAKRDTIEMNLATDITVANLGTIFEVAINSESKEQPTEYERNVHFILREIISDPIYSDHIVCHRADFFQEFLYLIKELKYYQRHSSVAIAFDGLMRASFSNINSYLYKEANHDLMGSYFRPFLEDIFGDYEMFRKYEPFDQLSFEVKENIDHKKLKLFLKSLEIAFRVYFKEERHINFEYSHYKKSFELLNTALSRVIDEINDKYEQKKNQWSESNIKLHEITFFVHFDLKNMYIEAKKENKISEIDLDFRIDERSYGIYPVTLTAGYIKLVYEMLTLLSDLSDKESIRHYALSLADDIITYNSEKTFDKGKELLMKYIWKGIKENVERGHFPLVLPTYLSIVGLWQDTGNQERKDMYNEVVGYLYTKLKPMIIKKETMGNPNYLKEDVLLNPSVSFNEKTGMFEYNMAFGSKQIMEIK